MDEIDEILKEFKIEFLAATQKFGKFHNTHEGYTVLLEEVDELWENVKLNQSKNPNRIKKIREEAIQVGAMAIRLIHDCCNENQDKNIRGIAQL